MHKLVKLGLSCGVPPCFGSPMNSQSMSILSNSSLQAQLMQDWIKVALLEALNAILEKKGV